MTYVAPELITIGTTKGLILGPNMNLRSDSTQDKFLGNVIESHLGLDE